MASGTLSVRVRSSQEKNPNNSRFGSCRLKHCSICLSRRSGSQLYSIRGDFGAEMFNVNLANELASQDGRSAELVPAELLRRLLVVNDYWNEQHLEHVEPFLPGIIGQRSGALLLIDGTHRAARALRDGTRFSAFILTEDETAACLVD